MRALERDRQKKDNHNISEQLHIHRKQKMWKFKSIRWKGHPNTKEHWWVNRKEQKPSWQKESAVRNQLFVLPEYTYYVLPIWTLPLAIFVNFFSKSCPSLSKRYLCNFECSVERRRRFNINDRIKELGGLLPTQVTNDGQLGVQQWMKSPMDTYKGKQCTRVN